MEDGDKKDGGGFLGVDWGSLARQGIERGWNWGLDYLFGRKPGGGGSGPSGDGGGTNVVQLATLAAVVILLILLIVKR